MAHDTHCFEFRSFVPEWYRRKLETTLIRVANHLGLQLSTLKRVAVQALCVVAQAMCALDLCALRLKPSAPWPSRVALHIWNRGLQRVTMGSLRSGTKWREMNMHQATTWGAKTGPHSPAARCCQAGGNKNDAVATPAWLAWLVGMAAMDIPASGWLSWRRVAGF